jgi:thiamine pyrophosphokinase
VIAADSGFDHAVALGLTVQHLVGDLDSISSGGLALARATAVAIQEHRPDKDATDTELAVDMALIHDCSHLIALSGGPSQTDLRLDHELGALLALAHPRLHDRRVEVWWGPAHVEVLHGPRALDLHGPTGTVVSLLPVSGSAEGITTSGMRYQLDAENLDAGSGRGLSNVVAAPHASISLGRGTLLVIEPFKLGGPR